jgi:DNA polymerase-3 subunit delta'
VNWLLFSKVGKIFVNFCKLYPKRQKRGKKYRTFADLFQGKIIEMIGQSHTKTFLKRLVQEKRVPHALLLLGPTGSGSLVLGLWLARLLQCEAEDNATGEPCGVCNACRKSGQHIHPDIHFSYPTIGTNAVSTDFIKQWRTAITENPYMDVNTWLQLLGAENKQGNINKEECNAIIKKLSLRVYEGKFKMLLMWRPEFLGKEGNRLLKLIEEPPEQTQFILIAEHTEDILPTVLSRCQIVKTDQLTDVEIEEGLQVIRQMAPDRAKRIAFLAEGNFQQALQLADNESSDDSALMLDWLRRCWRGNGPEMVAWTDKFAKMGRENQKQFIRYCLNFMRELMNMVAAGQNDLRLPEEELVSARNMARVLDFDKISRIVTMLNDNAYYIERNANPKILFLDTSIKTHRIMKG